MSFAQRVDVSSAFASGYFETLQVALYPDAPPDSGGGPYVYVSLVVDKDGSYVHFLRWNGNATTGDEGVRVAPTPSNVFHRWKVVAGPAGLEAWLDGAIVGSQPFALPTLDHLNFSVGVFSSQDNAASATSWTDDLRATLTPVP